MFKELVIFLTITISSVSVIVSVQNSQMKTTKEVSCDSENKTASEINTLAKSITVKVSATDQWGSGILVSQKDKVYTVVTNHHVIKKGKNYQIQTEDKIKHKGRLKNINVGKNDLAVLEFESETKYAIACLNNETSQKNDLVFASGYPLEANLNKDNGFVLTTGNITLISDKDIPNFKEENTGGYRIGYTNDIQNGMSGGPVLNSQGQVIGINGRHQPLFKKKPSQSDDSFAIPIQTFIQLIPPNDINILIVKNNIPKNTSSSTNDSNQNPNVNPTSAPNPSPTPNNQKPVQNPNVNPTSIPNPSLTPEDAKVTNEQLTDVYNSLSILSDFSPNELKKVINTPEGKQKNLQQKLEKVGMMLEKAVNFASDQTQQINPPDSDYENDTDKIIAIDKALSILTALEQNTLIQIINSPKAQKLKFSERSKYISALIRQVIVNPKSTDNNGK